MEAVFALADRITVLVNGRVIASEGPKAILANFGGAQLLISRIEPIAPYGRRRIPPSRCSSAASEPAGPQSRRLSRLLHRSLL